MGMIEKHELTLSFNTSEEMWQFVKETHTIDKIVGVEDYKHWIKENEDGVVREEYISKADYENRLKADMVAMLEELDFRLSNYQDTDLIRQDIQEKITKLRGNENGNE